MAHSSYACIFFASFDRRGVLDEQGLRVDGLLEISHRQKIGIRAEVWSTWNIFNPADSGGWGRLLGLGGYTETSFQYLLYSGYQYMESLPNWRLYPRPSTNLVHLYKKLCGYAYVSRQERFKNEEQTLSFSPYKYIYIYTNDARGKKTSPRLKRSPMDPDVSQTRWRRCCRTWWRSCPKRLLFCVALKPWSLRTVDTWSRWQVRRGFQEIPCNLRICGQTWRYTHHLSNLILIFYNFHQFSKCFSYFQVFFIE